MWLTPENHRPINKGGITYKRIILGTTAKQWLHPAGDINGVHKSTGELEIIYSIPLSL